MKRVLKYLIITLLIPLTSCSEKEIMQSTLPTEFETDALTKYEVPAEQGSDYSVAFTVQNPFNCTIKSDQDWCEVKIEWRAGIYVNLVVADNMTGKIRTAKVTLSSPKIARDFVIEINQLASVFEINGWKEDIKPEGEERMLYISADAPWTLETNADWITFDKTSGDMTTTNGVVEVKATIKPNDVGIIRSAFVTLKSTSGKEKVIVNEGIQYEPWETVVRIGDENIRFDNTKLDPAYPLYQQMLEWQKAGREAGIPSVESQMSNINKTFGPGTSVTELKTYLDGSDKYSKRNILLKNGEYNIDQSLRLYSQDILIGESRDGVILNLSNTGEVTFYNGNNIGLRNLTIKGAWSKDNPDPTKMEETLAGKGGYKSVNMSDAKDSYVDNVRIINSASHAIVISGSMANAGKGSHNTIRDVEIDGAYNKDGGYQGYFHIGGAYNLVTGCKVTHIRHISFQDPTSTYNVFYKNNVAQEVSFHNNDGGNNLVEHNKIIVPETLSNSYCAIMGPWSDQHKVGGKNFVYRNRCEEKNRGNYTPWSDNELYVGPWLVKPTDLYTNFRVTEEYPKPAGRTLYPIILKK